MTSTMTSKNSRDTFQTECPEFAVFHHCQWIHVYWVYCPFDAYHMAMPQKIWKPWIIMYLYYAVIWIYVSSCSGDWCRDDPKTRKRENRKDALRRDAPENAKTGREIMIKTIGSIGENPKARKWEKCKQEPKIWKLENWKRRKWPLWTYTGGGLASRFKVIKWFPHVSTIKRLGTAYKMSSRNPNQNTIFCGGLTPEHLEITPKNHKKSL